MTGANWMKEKRIKWILILAYVPALPLSLSNADEPSFSSPRFYSISTVPTATTVGDLNGDGLLDIAAVSDGSYPYSGYDINILLGCGSGTFQVQERRTVAGRGEMLGGVANADINNDGVLDLIVTNKDVNKVSVFMGEGDGQFTAPYEFPTGATPTSVVAQDFNNDDNFDLAIATARGVSILLGIGNGDFEDLQQLSTLSSSRSAIAGDFDEDGVVDLAMASYDDDAVALFLGVGDGSFITGNVVPVGDGPSKVVSGDFDGDGSLDLATGNALANTITVLEGNGDGSFSVSQTIPTYLQDIFAIGDFDGDGVLDLANSISTSNNNFSFTIRPGIGDGRFGLANISHLSGRGPKLLIPGDFDTDGQTDLAVGVIYGIAVHLNTGDGVLSSVPNYGVGGGPSLVLVGNFDSDKLPDIISLNYDSQDLSLLTNMGGSFATEQRIDVGESMFTGISGDLNGDGHDDLALINESYEISTFVCNGDGTFTPGQLVESINLPLILVQGDFNEDGIPDLASASILTSVLSVFIGNGDATFEPEQLVQLGDFGRFSLAVADMDSDGHLDLLTTSYFGSYPYEHSIVVVPGNGDGTFGAAWSHEIYREEGNFNSPRYIFPINFNDDGLMDVITSSPSGKVIVSYLQQPDRQFDLDHFQETGTGGMISVDFDSDGTEDMVHVGFAGRANLYRGHGNGAFSPGQSFITGQSSESIATGDFNGDGAPDLATASASTNAVTVLMHSGDFPVVRVVAPKEITVTRGANPEGGTSELAKSDNENFLLRRSSQDIEPITEVVFESTSSVANPASMSVTFEISAFQRSVGYVRQRVELFNYERQEWVFFNYENIIVNSSQRSETIVPRGLVSNYVDPETRTVKARIRHESNVNRRHFTTIIDQFTWKFHSN